MQKGLKIPRSLSLFLVLTVISVIVFTIFILVLPPFIKEFNEILVDIPNGLSKINILINTNLNKFNSLFYGEQSENKLLNLFRFVLISIFIFDKPFGMSTSISLNSFINGGNTRIKIVNIITDMTAKTRNKEIDRGIFKPFWI